MPGDEARRIGARAAQVGDGPTLQAASGEDPERPAGSGRAACGLDEMFSDGVLGAGAGRRPRPHVPLTAPFVFGSQGSPRGSYGNARVRMLRTEITNPPA